MKFLRIVLSFFLIGTILSSNAQKLPKDKKQLPTETPTAEKSFAQNVYDDYMEFYKNGGIFEKLYLMTDKPYYSAGDTIYFSGFLVHATLLTRFSESEFIYVELISPEGNLVERVKVCAMQRQFVGQISLSPRLSAGKYTLRAYSRWMTNFDMGYFYTRQVSIGNFIDDAIISKITYQKEPNGQVTGCLRLTNSYGEPMKGTQVRYRTIVDNRSHSGNGKTDGEGKLKFRFNPSDNPNDCIELNIQANYRDLKRFVQMPSFSEDFDVVFCPEGGHLVGGVAQIVAFKAVSKNGSSVEVSGRIVDEKGNKVADLATEHRGMGRFVLNASPSQKYYCECSIKSGIEKRFELPCVEAEGVVVRVLNRKEAYTIITQATPDVNLSDYVGVVLSRGAVMTVLEDLSHPASVRCSDMFDGIAQVSIVNRVSHRIIAERLFYVGDGRYAHAAIAPNKERYEQRDSVALKIKITDSEGKPAVGNFAMSVTDGNYVTLPQHEANIFSYMLLSSDLKGEVEAPGSYFDSEGRAIPEIDLVMLTNGWRRYSLESVLQHVYPRIMYPIEESQRICGSVFGLLGRARKPSIVVMDSKNILNCQQFELNEYNNFIISGLDAFSTTTYIVQALNRKGKDTTVRIKIETENYPIPIADNHRSFYESLVEPIPDSFLTRAKERYFQEGGEQIVDIEEVVITARKRPSSFFATGNTGSMLNGDLSRFSSVYDALATFKELNVSGRTITTRTQYRDTDISTSFSTITNAETEPGDEVEFTVDVSNNDMYTPELYVNGNYADIDEIDNYDMKYVERLAFVDGSAATMLGLSAPQGAIIMEVSAEGLSKVGDTDAIARVVVKACQKPEAFFKVSYPSFAERVKDNPDMRSTIAWEPLLRSNAEGEIFVTFYTADRSSTYDVVLEGVTDEGELCRKQTTLKVEYRRLF